MNKTGRLWMVACAALIILVACSACMTSPGFSPGKSVQKVSAVQNTQGSAASATPAGQSTGSSAGSCRQGLVPCGSNCVDTAVDIGNCGGCGLECPTNAYCEKSECYCKEGYAATSDGRCIPAPTTTQASRPQQNTGGNDNGGCPIGLIPCSDGYCYCGTCGNSCYTDQTCTNGQCTGGSAGNAPPPANAPSFGNAPSSGNCAVGSWCPNICTNLQVDNWNCGKCSNKCKDDEACFNGVCTKTSCNNQAWSCSGRCALLAGDFPPLNCGGCGKACPSGQLCYSGICKDLDNIPAGWHVCNRYYLCQAGNNDACKEYDKTTTFCGDGKTLAEGRTLLDPPVCCKTGETCVNGQCQGQKGECAVSSDCFAPLPSNMHWTCFVNKCVKSCNTGYSDCNSMISDGCEANLNADSKNCGYCDHACTSGSCVAGSCIAPVTLSSQGSSIVRGAQAIPPSWGGSWTGHTTADFDMSLTQSGTYVTGSYASGQGALTGSVSGNGLVLSGTARWLGGAPMNFQFTMASDGQSFTGSYSDAGGSHPWSGHR